MDISEEEELSSYGSEYDSADEDDDVFEAPPVVLSEAKFRVLKPADCLALAEVEVASVVELLCCKPEVAQLLLRHFRWNKDELTEVYMLDEVAAAAKAGLHLGEDLSVVHSAPGPALAVLVGGVPRAPASLPPLACQICFEDTGSYSALGCGHPFCNECYAEYLCHKIADEGHAAVFARCPDPKCSVAVSPALVDSLVRPEQLRKQYASSASLARSFVDDQPGLKWCPGTDCANAVRAKKRAAPLSVQCDCKHRFCFTCLHDDHMPCSCAALEKWKLKCHDDSETYNWLVANTKACPKCGNSIEKNGGCNHMTCKNTSCKYDFCWVCMGAWKDHSGSYYACNKYDPEKPTDADKKKDTSRAALERYLHYYTRFTNHHNSLKFELAGKEKMEAKIKEMEGLGDNTWMDCLYLSDANEALYSCRYALRYTYVYAFYLPTSSNFRHHFEMQQTELELQTEQLAELLEKEVSEIYRSDVVHCYQMAKKRLANLMELVASDEAIRVQREGEGENGIGAPAANGAGSSSGGGSAQA